MHNLISIQNATISFGKKVIFDNLSFNIHKGDKVSLVGKNGSGKSTLMNMITGECDFDSGKRVPFPGTSIAYLKQEISYDEELVIFDYLLPALKAEYQAEEYHYMIQMITEPLNIDLTAKMKLLSGGQLRRVALAYSLISDPDLLLLDEPTNHLDFESVTWLEEYLQVYRGTIICISHDRTFLKNISNKIMWLDRGTIKTCPKGYGFFDEWSQMILEQEQRELDNRDKALSLELDWANKGVKARRKRNVRRLDETYEEKEKLQADKSAFRAATNKMSVTQIAAKDSSKIIVEFIKVDKNFAEKKILNQFSLKIVKGDKIGILGKNGSGKTTFLKMLIGELEEDAGKIKRAKNLEISYFDQKRSILKANESIWRNLSPSGSEYISVMGKSRHVCGYLKDFAFDPQSLTEITKTLSGGQQNRLLLAKVLADPGTCLILDEPTNDLDMDTLDILEEILDKFTGTLIVVSHDRDFLDQTVNKIMSFEGDALVETYLGNYSDYKAQKDKQKSTKIKKPEKDKPLPKKTNQKIPYELKKELDSIPKKIDKINEQLKISAEKFTKPEFYNDEEKSKAHQIKSTELQESLQKLEERWLEIIDNYET